MPKYHIDKSFIKEPLRFDDIYLVQIGRLHFTPGDSMHAHAHKNWYELTIITDGEGEVITNGIPTPVRRGDIYISLPCDTHAIRSSVHAPMKYDFFSFFTDDAQYCAVLDDITKYLHTDERVFNDERIGALVCDAILEFIEGSDFSEELLYSIFKQIIIYTVRNINHRKTTRTLNATGKEELCYQIMNYIDTHIYMISNLASVGEELKYNYSYLSALFKQTTGYTLESYYRKKRLETARLLIIEGVYKAVEIADMLNYSSLYAFSRAFKEMYGSSPRDYKNRKSD